MLTDTISMRYLVRYLITAIVSLLTVVSCTGSKTAGKADRAGSPSAVGSNTSGETHVTGDTIMNASPAKADSAAWMVTEFGIGPVRAGMTVAEARAALDGALTETSSTPSCGYATSSRAPKGVNFMIVGGKIARVDVRGGTVTAAAGAKIGDTEQRVRALYPGRIAVTPHKYTNGHYLTVTPSNPADSAYRMVFETDSSRVTVYRSGLRPPVEWVEGCS